MNILFINNLYGNASAGGAEEIVRIRAERFASEGHRVFVMSSGKEEKKQRNEATNSTYITVRPKNLCVYKELSQHGFLFRMFCHVLNFLDIWTAKRIVRFCRKHEIDLVETHNLIGISMQVPRLLRKAGITHHHYLHDVQLVEPSGILPATHTSDTIVQRIYSFFIRLVFGSPAVVMSPTKFLKEFYCSRGFFPKSEWRIEYEKLMVFDTKEVRKKKEEGDVKRYLFVGSLVEHKGVRQLLSAWKNRETRDTYHETLTIVGDGVLRSLVEGAVEVDPSITYLGRIPHEDLGSIYTEHDVLLFSSQCIENRPNVIAEAMAYGLEIIAVKTGGVEEMVEGYIQVTLVNPGNFVIG